MAEWPKTIAKCPEHGFHGCRAECFDCGGPVEQVPVDPHDLAQELYEALVDAIAHNCNATPNDSAVWTQEDYDKWDAARARYEREVGT